MTFKFSLLHGKHRTRKVRIFLCFYVNTLFLPSCIVHLLSEEGCSNFCSALLKNTPDNVL